MVGQIHAYRIVPLVPLQDDWGNQYNPPAATGFDGICWLHTDQSPYVDLSQWNYAAYAPILEENLEWQRIHADAANALLEGAHPLFCYGRPGDGVWSVESENHPGLCDCSNIENVVNFFGVVWLTQPLM